MKQVNKDRLAGWARWVRMGMLLALFGCFWMVIRADAEEAPSVLAQPGSEGIGRYRLAFWIGGGLIGLGLIGGLGAMLLNQRHRLQQEERLQQQERDRFQESIFAQRNRQRELEAEIERQRRTIETLRGLEAEIDRQQRAAEALRASEQRFRTLTQQLPVGVFMTDIQGECRYVNDRWRQWVGLTADQAAGSLWLQTVHPDDREPVMQGWRQTVEQGGEFAAIHRLQSPSGRVTWLNTCAVPLQDRAGRVSGYLGASTDIADLKRCLLYTSRCV